MRVTTGRQLEGVKTLADLTPVAATLKSKGSKSDGGIAVAATTRSGGDVSRKAEKSGVAAKKPESRNPQSQPTGNIDPKPEDHTTSGMSGLGVRTRTKVELKSAGYKNCNDCEVRLAREEADEASSSSDGDDQTKMLTEAGKKRLVDKLLGLADTQATQGGYKITPADLIRLLQLHREMNPQKDRKVTVQWIEDEPE
jgi:hypothetical protein